MGDSEDPEPRAATDRHEEVPQTEAGAGRAQRGAAAAAAGGAATASPGQHAR